MDTRKLEILKTSTYAMLSLAEPGQGGDIITRLELENIEAMREVRRRYNAHTELLAALEALELRCTQARIASSIGQPRLKDADFLRRELERIAMDARAAITNATKA
jgi:hypothetical protein